MRFLAEEGMTLQQELSIGRFSTFQSPRPDHKICRYEAIRLSIGRSILSVLTLSKPWREVARRRISERRYRPVLWFLNIFLFKKVGRWYFIALFISSSVTVVFIVPHWGLRCVRLRAYVLLRNLGSLSIYSAVGRCFFSVVLSVHFE